MNRMKLIALAALIGIGMVSGTAYPTQARIFYPDRCAGTGDPFGDGKWFDKPWYCYLLP